MTVLGFQLRADNLLRDLIPQFEGSLYNATIDVVDSISKYTDQTTFNSRLQNYVFNLRTKENISNI